MPRAVHPSAWCAAGHAPEVAEFDAAQRHVDGVRGCQDAHALGFPGIGSRLLMCLASFTSVLLTATETLPQLLGRDYVWAILALGESTARFAAQYVKAESTDEVAIDLLSILTNDPAPFCREFFDCLRELISPNDRVQTKL